MDFKFAAADEISREVGARLKRERLAQGLTQVETAARAGIARGALLNLENNGVSTLGTFVRVVQALGLESAMQDLFVRKAHSIAELEQLETASPRRARRSSRGQGSA